MRRREIHARWPSFLSSSLVRPFFSKSFSPVRPPVLGLGPAILPHEPKAKYPLISLTRSSHRRVQKQPSVLLVQKTGAGVQIVAGIYHLPAFQGLVRNGIDYVFHASLYAPGRRNDPGFVAKSDPSLAPDTGSRFRVPGLGSEVSCLPTCSIPPANNP